MKSRRKRWTGNAALMGENTKFWWGNLRERDHSEGPDIDTEMDGKK
jgi:hypothetical protein